MSLTIDEMYKAAASGETSWEHALLLTGLLYFDGLGLVVSPLTEDMNEYAFYKSILELLNKYPNNNANYRKTIETLSIQIENQQDQKHNIFTKDIGE